MRSYKRNTILERRCVRLAPTDVLPMKYRRGDGRRAAAWISIAHGWMINLWDSGHSNPQPR